MSADDIAKRLKPISLEKAKESYQNLKDFKCGTIPTLTREGTKALEHWFLPFRLQAKTKKNISFMGALKDRKVKTYLLNKTRKIKKYDKLSRKKTPDEVLRNMHGTFELYYGTINQFRPAVAKWLYCHLGTKLGILDFSSGWGGRCLGAMSLGIPYYGFDANTKLDAPYRNMIRALDPGANVVMKFQPSETAVFKGLKYDLVFTSPPYFMLEQYEGMPKYDQDQGFLDDFFIPVVKNAWEHLQTGGYMALNMPQSMFEPIKLCLPKLFKKVKMPLMDRHASEAAAGGDLKKGTTKRSEWIYIWKKVGHAMFNEDAKRCGLV